MAFEVPEYTNEDFKKLLFPIFEIPDGESILDKMGNSNFDYPEFKVVLGPFGFKPGDKDKVIKYIACVYDMGSPFVTDFQDINHRKITAAIFVGFVPDDYRRFSPEVEKMMLGHIDPITDMIIRYCRNYNSPDYSYLVAIMDDYYRILKLIHMGEDYNYDKSRKMREDVKSLSRAFLGGENSLSLLSRLYKNIEQDSLLLRAEDIAQKQADGIPPITDQEISKYRSEHIKGVSPTGSNDDGQQ